jgi:hypothetical protein
LALTQQQAEANLLAKREAVALIERQVWVELLWSMIHMPRLEGSKACGGLHHLLAPAAQPPASTRCSTSQIAEAASSLSAAEGSREAAQRDLIAAQGQHDTGAAVRELQVEWD